MLSINIVPVLPVSITWINTRRYNEQTVVGDLDNDFLSAASGLTFCYQDETERCFFLETRTELRAFSVSQSLICSRPEEIKRVGFSLQNLRVLSHTIDSIANSLFVVNQREKERERITLRKKH